MNSVSFWITRFTLMMMFLLVSVMILMPLYFSFQSFIEHHEALRITLSILAFVWFVLIVQLSHVMASRMVFEQQTFMAALRHSVAEARMAAGSVPLLGRWVAPKPARLDGQSDTPIE